MTLPRSRPVFPDLGMASLSELAGVGGSGEDLRAGEFCAQLGGYAGLRRARQSPRGVCVRAAGRGGGFQGSRVALS